MLARHFSNKTGLFFQLKQPKVKFEPLEVMNVDIVLINLMTLI